MERPSAALMRKVCELLSAGDFAVFPVLAEPCPPRVRGCIPCAAMYRTRDRSRWRRSGVPRPGGQIAVFGNDHNTLTTATSRADPLQSCTQASVANYVNDPGSWAEAAMLAPAGFTRP